MLGNCKLRSPPTHCSRNNFESQMSKWPTWSTYFILTIRYLLLTIVLTTHYSLLTTHY
jgi:hypothetical protein